MKKRFEKIATTQDGLLRQILALETRCAASMARTKECFRAARAQVAGGAR